MLFYDIGNMDSINYYIDCYICYFTGKYFCKNSSGELVSYNIRQQLVYDMLFVVLCNTSIIKQNHYI